MAKAYRSFSGGGRLKLRSRVVVRFDSKKFLETAKRMARDPEPLKRYAFYLRLVAKRSIRKVNSKKSGKAYNRASKVNSPPRSRFPGHPLRNLMQAAFDTGDLSYVIGPEVFRRSKTTPRVPGIHEKAKRVVITRKRPKHQSTTRARSKNQARSFAMKMKHDKAFRDRYMAGKQPSTFKEVVKYPPRPFMVPALKKTVAKFPRMWAKGANLQ